jgi:hypothetical protein
VEIQLPSRPCTLAFVGRETAALTTNADPSCRTDPTPAESAPGCASRSHEPGSGSWALAQQMSRWVTCRRSTRGRSPLAPPAAETASSPARVRASTVSVLAVALAIARVLDGFDTTTPARIGVSRFAIAPLLPVAPARPIIWAKSAAMLATLPLTAIRPTSRTSPSSNRELREPEMHIRCDIAPPPRTTSSSLIDKGQPLGRTTPTDTRSRRSRTSRRDGQLLTRADGPPRRRACPSVFPAPVPDGHTVCRTTGGQSLGSSGQVNVVVNGGIYREFPRQNDDRRCRMAFGYRRGKSWIWVTLVRCGAIPPAARTDPVPRAARTRARLAARPR